MKHHAVTLVNKGTANIYSKGVRKYTHVIIFVKIAIFWSFPWNRCRRPSKSCGSAGRVSGRSENMNGTGDWDATHGKSNGVSHALTFSTPIVSTIRIIMLTRRTSLAVVCGGAMGRGEAKEEVCVSAR